MAPDGRVEANGMSSPGVGARSVDKSKIPLMGSGVVIGEGGSGAGGPSLPGGATARNIVWHFGQRIFAPPSGTDSLRTR